MKKDQKQNYETSTRIVLQITRANGSYLSSSCQRFWNRRASGYQYIFSETQTLLDFNAFINHPATDFLHPELLGAEIWKQKTWDTFCPIHSTRQNWLPRVTITNGRHQYLFKPLFPPTNKIVSQEKNSAPIMLSFNGSDDTKNFK